MQVQSIAATHQRTVLRVCVCALYALCALCALCASLAL